VIPPVTAAPSAAASSAARADTPGDRKLRDAARQLEGVFVQELFKAMRATVPQGEGIVSGGSGEEMFTAMLDQHLATTAPNRWEGGIGDALYRQLRGTRLPAPSVPATAPASVTLPVPLPTSDGAR
jgi:flagellar protein FlgJ